MRSLIRQKFREAPGDPAPSRLVYRYQRLLLTPGFRVFARIGVPIILVVVVLASWFSHAENRAMLQSHIDAALEVFQSRPQFMVNNMVVVGADAELAKKVEDSIDVIFPASSLALDLAAIRNDVEALEPVKTAALRVGHEGALEVRITTRVPVALWRDGAVLRLIDADGVPSGSVAVRADRRDLPLIAGDGAKDKITEALALYAGAGPLRGRVRGFLRMGERRWDIILDRDQRILLPSDNPIAAFERIIALNAAEDMLERDVLVVDMRTAHRPTLRMSEEASLALRRATEKK